MKKLYLISVFLIISAMLLTCSHEPFEGLPVIYEDFTEARYLRVTEPGVWSFNDSDSWTAFCDEYWRDNGEPPDVDFDNVTVVGIFYGMHSGCYEWVNCVRAVFIKRNVIEVHIGRMPDIGLCDMIVNPLQVIKVNKPNMPVVFYGHVPGRPE